MPQRLRDRPPVAPVATRVAIVSDNSPLDHNAWSGIPHQIHDALIRRGAAVAVFGTPRLDRLMRPARRYLLRFGIDVTREPVLSILYAALLDRRLAGFQPTFVLSIASSQRAAALSRRFALVHFSDATFRAMLDYYPGEFSRIGARTRRNGDRVERRVLSRADLVVLPSAWAARSALSDYEAPPDRIAILPMGANAADPQASCSTLQTPDDGRLRILFCGVDWVRKGGRIAVEAVRRLAASGLQVELHVVGCAPPGEESCDQLRLHGFLDRANPADRERLDELFRSAAFFLLPTQAEAYGIVFAEAAAYGVPAISFKTGGVTTAVLDGVTGVLLDPTATSEDFASAIHSLWTDRTRYMAMREAARRRYETELNWDAWAESLLERARSVAAQAHAPTPRKPLEGSNLAASPFLAALRRIRDAAPWLSPRPTLETVPAGPDVVLGCMTPPDDAKLSATQKLALLVAKRNASAGSHPGGLPGRRSSERSAAAASASKSKPAPRKG